MKNDDHFNPRGLLIPTVLTAAFWMIAVLIWQVTGNRFFLWNFGYIGTAIGLGMGLFMALPRRQRVWGRKLAQSLVGLYLFGYVGVALKENMQLEGFFFYLLMGYFSGSTIHYLVAKVAGPLLFGRGWCGWACWTAMLLDFLPYPVQKTRQSSSRWALLRYVHFFLSLGLVIGMWFGLGYRADGPQDGLLWMLAGNLFYYGLAVILAFAFKDNRAFCKLACPIPVLQKVTSRFALIKVAAKAQGCNGCRACVRECPMNVDILRYTQAGQRVLSTECIICQACVNTCPNNALHLSLGLDDYFGGVRNLQTESRNQ